MSSIADERVAGVRFLDDSLMVDLMGGRTTSAPIVWFPRLPRASDEERAVWEVSAGGYGIHWPLIDEDLSSAGLLRGARAAALSR